MITNTKLFLFFITIFTSFSIYSQDSVFTNSNELDFNNSSEERVIKINIDESIFQLDIRVESIIENGELSLEIYRPANTSISGAQLNSIPKEIIGEFSIGRSTLIKDDKNSKTNEKSMSQLNKVIKDPEKGVYVIKFISKNTTGKVKISITQFSN